MNNAINTLLRALPKVDESIAQLKMAEEQGIPMALLKSVVQREIETERGKNFAK